MENDNEKVVKKGSLFLKIFFTILSMVIIASVTVGFISYNKKKEEELARQEMMAAAVNVNNIYENIFVNDINIGGLTKEQAIKKLETEIQKTIDEKKISLKNNEDSFSFYFKDFNFKYDLEKGVNEAFAYAREGETEQRYNKITELINNPLKINVGYTYDKSLIDASVLSISENIIVNPIEATMKRENGQFIITDGSDGIQMDVEKTISAVDNLVKDNISGDIIISTKPLPAKFRTKDLQNAQTLIGSSVTRYSGRGTPRVSNMDVAASRVKNSIVYPGEVFSTEKALGPSTLANGYLNAPAIIKGKLVDDVGGGVCQISSTLYQALLNAEVEIVQRRNHSLKVGYADWGFDATLYEGSIDLEFRNNTDLPMLVESYLTENQVIVNIYGKEIHNAGRTLEFKNEFVRTIKAPASKIKYDANLPTGTRKVEINALDGKVYNVFKYVYENGQLVEKVLINTSTYSPRAEEVVVGTGAVASAPDETPTETPAEQPTTQDNPPPAVQTEEVPAEAPAQTESGGSDTQADIPAN